MGTLVKSNLLDRGAMAKTEGTTTRRGRPRSGERPERERRILDAALIELTENGYERVTMLAIAKRAGASKETLYGWFGSKEGLFAALITRNADESAERVRSALTAEADTREVLVSFATGLLTLLTSDGSIALNRASMNSPELAEVLLANGRFRVGPLVEEYLGQLSNTSAIRIGDPGESFRLLYGLIMRDTQIRVLLGEPAPTTAAIRRHAATAVEEFLTLIEMT